MGKILIVDDDAEIRKTLRLLLEGAGDISEAANGPDALRQISADKPKLMLLDITMPEMGGIAVLETALELDPSLIVLMLTGEKDIATAKGALDLGARAFITKPFDGPALRRQVEELMTKKSGGAPTSGKPWRVE